jgi:hypothetical protein
MKLYKNKKLKSCECGSVEFITQPNRYDIYEIIDGELMLIQSEFTDDEEILFCRECCEKFDINNTLHAKSQ